MSYIFFCLTSLCIRRACRLARPFRCAIRIRRNPPKLRNERAFFCVHRIQPFFGFLRSAPPQPRILFLRPWRARQDDDGVFGVFDLCGGCVSFWVIMPRRSVADRRRVEYRRARVLCVHRGLRATVDGFVFCALGARRWPIESNMAGTRFSSAHMLTC